MRAIHKFKYRFFQDFAFQIAKIHANTHTGIHTHTRARIHTHAYFDCIQLCLDFRPTQQHKNVDGCEQVLVGVVYVMLTVKSQLFDLATFHIMKGAKHMHTAFHCTTYICIHSMTEEKNWIED